MLKMSLFKFLGPLHWRHSRQEENSNLLLERPALFFFDFGSAALLSLLFRCFEATLSTGLLSIGNPVDCHEDCRDCCLNCRMDCHEDCCLDCRLDCHINLSFWIAICGLCWFLHYPRTLSSATRAPLHFDCLAVWRLSFAVSAISLRLECSTSLSDSVVRLRSSFWMLGRHGSHTGLNLFEVCFEYPMDIRFRRTFKSFQVEYPLANSSFSFGRL